MRERSKLEKTLFGALIGGFATAAAGGALVSYATNTDEQEKTAVIEEQKTDHPYAYAVGMSMFAAGAVAGIASGVALDRQEENTFRKYS